MTKLLLAAAIAIAFVAGSPAFGMSLSIEGEDPGTYPPSASCRFITGQIVLPNGNVIFAVFQTAQVCN
jgi:hypothetical protein